MAGHLKKITIDRDLYAGLMEVDSSIKSFSGRVNEAVGVYIRYKQNAQEAIQAADRETFAQLQQEGY